MEDQNKENLVELMSGIGSLLEEARKNAHFLDQHYHGEEVDCGFHHVDDYVDRGIRKLRHAVKNMEKSREKRHYGLVLKGIETTLSEIYESRGANHQILREFPDIGEVNLG